MSDSQLIGLLEQIGEVEAGAAVKVDYKRKAFDSDDDLDLDNLDLW